jgi:hypothetical protein
MIIYPCRETVAKKNKQPLAIKIRMKGTIFIGYNTRKKGIWRRIKKRDLTIFNNAKDKYLEYNKRTITTSTISLTPLLRLQLTPK